MTYIIKEKIHVGISACNYGAMVRWNHKGWDRIGALGRERTSFVWTPVCPEVNGGLGVTRMPVRLVGGNGDEFWKSKARMKNRSGQDVTEQAMQGVLDSMDIIKRAGVEAFVFMEGSPTCGVYRTTLKNKRLGKPPGIFGSLLLKEDLFLIPALDLLSPVKWWDWRRRLHAFVWLKRTTISKKKEIYDIWYHMKFLCQEADDRRAREIGRKLAAMPRKFDRAFAEAWRKEVLQLLRRPSTIPRIVSIMQKHLAHYRKHFNPDAKELKPPRSDMARRKILAELLEMEKRAVKEDYTFAGAPVIHRESP